MTESQKKGIGKGALIAFSVLLVILTFSNILTYTNLQNQITALNVEKNTLQSQVNKLTNEKNNLQSLVDSLTDEKSNLQSQLGSLNTAYQNYKATHSHSNSEYNSLQSAYGSYKRTHEYSNSEYDALQSRLNRILSITVTQHYEWDYEFLSWYWDLPIPLSLYVEYWERLRPTSWDDWIFMAKDSDDDYYIDQMIREINTAAIKEGFTELEKVNFVIAFVQSLPYTEDDVATPWNEYPKYPIETLFDRGGDCEDTSILVAALLDRLGYDVALLILLYENHAAVGVSIEGAYGSYYPYEGKEYFYLETTGEGWEIGEIPSFEDTRAYIYPLNP